jgi:hypothetical protein
MDKFSANQERPPIPFVWPVKIGTNLTRPEIVKLENAGFQLPQKERITPTRLFNTTAPPWTSPEYTFLPTQTRIFLPGSLRLPNDLPLHHPKTNADDRICTSYGRDHSESHYNSTPWIWLRAHLAIQTSTYTIHLPTDS